MSSSLIVTLEFLGVIGVMLGLGVWELVRLQRERRRDAEAQRQRDEAGDGTGAP